MSRSEGRRSLVEKTVCPRILANDCGMAARMDQALGYATPRDWYHNPARPSTPEAETNPHQSDGPLRTAEHVAA